MVHPLSHDLRKRIVKAVDQGLSRNQAAAKFDVAVSTAVKLMQHVKETGGVAPKKIGGYRRHKLKPHDALVRELVSATADATLDGPMDGETFKAWTEQFLAPILKPGDVVIMDKLSAHKVAGIREAIEAQGAHLLSLPPYSPDLTPIGQVFAKFKALLRKAAARSVDKLWLEIGNALRHFTPTECAAYLKHCGYSK